MHELSVSSAILETVLKHADGRRVTAVEMKIGRLRQVVPDSLDFYFGIVSRDTLADGAALDQKLIDALLRCNVCATEWDPAPKPAEEEADILMPPMFRCPACEAGGAEVVRGEELEVDSIIVDDDAPVASATGGAA